MACHKTVEMPLPAKAAAHWDMTRHAFVLEPGQVELLAGASSADIRLTKTIAAGN
jgi:beta-glucosidase